MAARKLQLSISLGFYWDFILEWELLTYLRYPGEAMRFPFSANFIFNVFEFRGLLDLIEVNIFSKCYVGFCLRMSETFKHIWGIQCWYSNSRKIPTFWISKVFEFTVSFGPIEHQGNFFKVSTWYFTKEWVQLSSILVYPGVCSRDAAAPEDSHPQQTFYVFLRLFEFYWRGRVFFRILTRDFISNLVGLWSLSRVPPGVGA